MDLILSLLVDGICTGARYAILGMGFALIFNTQRMFDLSFGGVYTWTGFVFWLLAAFSGLPLTLAAVLSLAFCLILSYGVQKVYVSQLRKKSSKSVSIMLGSMAVMMIMEAVVAIIWGGEIRVARTGDAGIFKWGSVQISDIKLYTIVSALALFLLVEFVFMRTPLGIKSRAIASNPRLSLVVGLDAEKIVILATCFGCALVGLDAVLVCADTGVYPAIGFQSMLIAFMAVILGGIGSFEGAFLGGMIIGLVRTFAVLRFPTLWQELISFAVLFFIIAFKPNGLLGIRDWKSEV